MLPPPAAVGLPLGSDAASGLPSGPRAFRNSSPSSAVAPAARGVAPLDAGVRGVVGAISPPATPAAVASPSSVLQSTCGRVCRRTNGFAPASSCCPSLDRARARSSAVSCSWISALRLMRDRSTRRRICASRRCRCCSSRACSRCSCSSTSWARSVSPLPCASKSSASSRAFSAVTLANLARLRFSSTIRSITSGVYWNSECALNMRSNTSCASDCSGTGLRAPSIRRAHLSNSRGVHFSLETCVILNTRLLAPLSSNNPTPARAPSNVYSRR
mmetsp:Transcript_11260/g.35946  ORF Transcript_11260/g.35946 Transcript_11260/m.35946 type:complete len:273 (-) Transcript_11260:385-1203(-)